MEGLLQKCKETITSNREKITQLTTENSELKNKLTELETDQVKFDRLNSHSCTQKNFGAC